MKLILQKLVARPLPWFLGGVTALLYLHLFVLPGTPILVAVDQGVYMLDAVRMLEGQMIYRDFFQFTTPGIQVVYLTLFKLFGARAWIPNAILVLVGFSFTWLSVVISRKFLRGPTAYLPGLLFVVTAFFNNLDTIHHWCSALAVMAGLAVVMEKRTLARVAAAAGLCGVAAFFSQTAGALAIVGFSLFLLWEQRRKRQNWGSLLIGEAGLFASFLTTVLALHAYFVWKVGLQCFLDHTVVFPLKYARAFPYNNLQVYTADLPQALHWYQLHHWGTWLFIHALLPLVYLLFFARYWREAGRRPEEPWDRLMLLNVVGLSLFMSMAPAPSFWRLCTVSLPAQILFVWFMRPSGKLFHAIRGLLWVGAAVLIVGVALRRQTQWRIYLAAPSGRSVLFSSDVYDPFQWLLDRTRPAEFFFDCWGGLYFPLGLRNPTQVPLLSRSDFTRPEQVRNVVEALEKQRVRLVRCAPDNDDMPGAWEPPAGDHLGPLRTYLLTHYHVVKTFPGGYTFWERNPEPIEETPSKASVR
jgi:hypothetical protein